MNRSADLIGVDWGTSNLRVMRIAAGGGLLEERSDGRGAGGLGPGDFAGVLEAVAGEWLAEAPVLICGMAGARGRWRETAYQPCPADAAALGRAVVRPDAAGEAFIVPGVAVMADDGPTDVMRGEETQVTGLFAAGESGTVVAPGTHSKWIRVEDGRIEDFRTFMTGELFAAIRRGTILVPDGQEPGGDEAAFRRGVERGLADPAVTAALFSARVEVLAGRLAAEGAADYLSGLLIGAEIGAQPGPAPVTIVGADGLAARYRTALAVAGYGDVRSPDGETITARGLWRIWEART